MKSLLLRMGKVVLATALAGVFSATAFGAESVALKKEELTSADCVKCHASEPAAIAANGAAHKTSVGCQDCHVSHRPLVKNNIPPCSQCHSGKPHYKLTGCQRCHNNPHTPKIIKLANNITEECLSCHSQQIVKLKQFKSKHTNLACSFCHNVHGKIPDCTQCHKPHAADMGAAECKRCHQGHMPTVITYTKDTPNKMCASCHQKAFDQLAKSVAKHKSLACATCHKEKHKTVPTCKNCHGAPHPAGMLARFPKCGECHNTAHDLNRWDKIAPAEGKETPAAQPRKGVRKK